MPRATARTAPAPPARTSGGSIELLDRRSSNAAVARRAGRRPRLPRRRSGACENPPSCTFVAAVVDGPVLVAGVGRRQPLLLVRRRRHRDSRSRSTTRGPARRSPRAPPARSPKQIRGPMRSPAGSASTRPAGDPTCTSVADRAGAGCSCAATGSGTTARPPPSSARLLAATRSRASATIRSRWRRRSCDWANEQGGHDNITVALAHLTPTAAAAETADPDRGATVMADWTTEVFENEYLPADATDVHAIVTVTCQGAGRRRPVRRRRRGDHRRHVGLDVVAALQDRRRRARPRRPRSTRSSTARGSRSSPATTTRTLVYPDRARHGAGRRDTRGRGQGGGPAPRRRRRHRDRQLAAAPPTELFATVEADAAPRDPAHRRPERDRDAEPSSRPAIDAAPRRVPVRLPRRRRRLGGQRAARHRVGAARLGRHHRRAREDGRGLPGDDARVDGSRRRRREAAGLDAAGLRAAVRPPGRRRRSRSSRPRRRRSRSSSASTRPGRGATSRATITSR